MEDSVSRWQRLAFRAKQFDPRTIPGIVGWWDFSDPASLRQTTAGATAVTADGDVVGYALDKSGNSRPMAANNDARRPVYKVNILSGRSAVRFDGVDDALGATTHSGTASETQTWFGVFANISTAAGSRRFIARADNASLFVDNGTTPMRVAYWAFGTSTFTTPTTAIGNAIYSLTYTSASQCLVRQNGKLIVTVGTPNGSYRTSTSLFLGANSLAGANATACDCLEAMIWHVALSAAERSAVEKYLAKKYGLTLS
jgi:hypothetical protein